MSDFFQQSLQQPLAERLRPTILSDVVGQSHLLGDGGPIRLMYDMAKVHSMIYGGLQESVKLQLLVYLPQKVKRI